MENKDVKRENAEGDHQHDEISSSVRTERPGNFLFKIQSFSLFRATFTESNRDKLDSRHFKNEGYKWKLTVYPNGDKKRGGDGYISLYLALAEPKSLPQGREVHVFFKFFVYDYLRDTYLVLQDGKDRRFHALNTEWGFAKLLPLEIFTDPSQGYLVNDRCAFGVEMFIHKKESKLGSTLSMKNSLGAHESTFTWKIDKFSKFPDNVYISSKVFSAGGRKWKLSVYPNGDKKSGGDGYISLYLSLAEHMYLSRNEEVHVLFKFFVFDYLRDTCLVLQDGKDRRFHALKTVWGFAKLVPLEIFNDPCHGYLVDDRCAFGVEMFFHNKKESKMGSSISIRSSLAACEKTLTWKISNFSNLIVPQVCRIFSAGGRQWYLRLWPRGIHPAQGKSVSLSLILMDKLFIPSGWNIYADFRLSILDQLKKKHHVITEKGKLLSAVSGKSCDYPGFMQLRDLKCGSRGFIVHDTVVVQLEFMAIYSVNPSRT